MYFYIFLCLYLLEATFNKRQEELERRLILVQMARGTNEEKKNKLDFVLKQKLPECDLSELKKLFEN